jgi:hypothetical protein
MVRESRRLLSRAPNAHSVVSRVKFARKIANLDCLPLFGQTEDQPQEQFASEILASPITIHGSLARRSPATAGRRRHGSRITIHDSLFTIHFSPVFPSPCPPYVTDPAPGTVIRKHWNDQSFRFVRAHHRPGDVGDDGQSQPTSHRCGHRPS